jgi:hypothetical protein
MTRYEQALVDEIGEHPALAYTSGCGSSSGRHRVSGQQPPTKIGNADLEVPCGRTASVNLQVCASANAAWTGSKMAAA